MKKKMPVEVEVKAGPTSLQAFLVHLACGSGLVSALWLGHKVYSISLVSNPSQLLGLIGAIESPIIVLLYSLFRGDPKHCSILKATGRAILGILAGAFINAFGAIALGAPVGIQYLPSTFYWSLLMSLFTFVPAAAVYGASWRDWQRIFGHTKPVETIDFMICVPAHGAVIGAWVGAWPMPLDWERPWQEWPVCVTYGAMGGYCVGMLVSLGFVLSLGGGRLHMKVH